jgi:quercetin dioxygenase-like cupin family protein
MAEDLEFYIVRFRPGGSLISSPHFPRTEEFTTCLSGALEVTSAEGTIALNPGDMAHYVADVPHSIRVKGKGPAEAFLVVRYAKQ